MTNLGKLLFSFGGRINRAKFWLATFIGFFWIVVLTLADLALVDPSTPTNEAISIALFLIAIIPTWIAGIAVGIKRLHDRDKSGWWLLLFYLAPGLLDGIGGVAAVATPILGLPLFIASVAVNIWMMVELGCLHGTIGPNHYGPDPLEGTAA